MYRLSEAPYYPEWRGAHSGAHPYGSPWHEHGGVVVPGICVWLGNHNLCSGDVLLVSGFALDILDKPTAGITVVGVVAGMFTVALTALIIGAFVPNDTVRLVVNGGLTIALLLALRYLLRKYRR